MTRIRKYTDMDVVNVIDLITFEARSEGKSVGWTYNESERDLYLRIRKELSQRNIEPLDDLFGTWVSVSPDPDMHQYEVQCSYTVSARSNEEAVALCSEKTITPDMIQCVIKKPKFRPSMHITYWEKDGVIRYRMSDGSQVVPTMIIKSCSGPTGRAHCTTLT